TWRDATAMVKLGDRVCRPDARSAIERGPQVVVEELSARRDEQLVERAEQARIAARKEESEEAGTRQRGCGVDEGVPRGRYLRTRATGGAFEEVAAVVEQPHVEVARDLQERAVDARELERPRQKIAALGGDRQVVERREPRGLGRRVFRVRRDQIEIGGARLEVAPDLRVQLRVRKPIDDLDGQAGRALEGRNAVVERVV